MTDPSAALPPMRLGEIVLGTGRYDEMKAWYGQVLDIEPSLEHAVKEEVPKAGPSVPTRMCFFRLHTEHPYQDVIAIFEMPGTRSGRTGDPGLHHMQLRNSSLAVLRERYRRLRAVDVVPYLAMDHGPSTSLYYRDPDHNVVEIAATNFATLEETQACLASDRYRRNPAGEVIDPESMFDACRTDAWSTRSQPD